MIRHHKLIRMLHIRPILNSTMPFLRFQKFSRTEGTNKVIDQNLALTDMPLTIGPLLKQMGGK